MTRRTDLPEKVRSLLAAPGNVAIHGSPGSGKSWICDQVERLLAADQKTIRVDVSTQTTGKGVLVEILRTLDSGTDQGQLDDAPLREVWRSLRSKIENEDQHVVLLLDQFDSVVKFDDSLEFLNHFRELVHRPESLKCTALMISRRSLKSIETRVSGISTLASVCFTEYLGSLTEDDLISLNIGASDLSSEEKRACLEWAAGHPSLARYWLATRPDKFPDPSADMERAKIALQVVDLLHELDLIDAAAQIILGPKIDSFLFQQRELQLLGVTAFDDDEGLLEQVSLSMQPHFQDALRHRTWGMSPWGVLGKAEVSLRGLVETILAEGYGTEWATDLRKKNPEFKRIFESANEKLARDRKMYTREAPWLAYTYPGELWSIIQMEWSYFASVFDSHDKPYWRGVITGLAKYRTPYAHVRSQVLNEAEVAQCRMYAESVLHCIEQHEIAATVGHVTVGQTMHGRV